MRFLKGVGIFLLSWLLATFATIGIEVVAIAIDNPLTVRRGAIILPLTIGIFWVWIALARMKRKEESTDFSPGISATDKFPRRRGKG